MYNVEPKCYENISDNISNDTCLASWMLNFFCYVVGQRSENLSVDKTYTHYILKNKQDKILC